MGVAFPILLGGLALAGIPVLLHLILRQKPKTLQFPAFRFLIQKHRSNLRKLQLRHVLLLGLRILLIVALCLALAQLKLTHDSFNVDFEQPVAAIVLVDTGPTMDYRVSDKVSRLDEAKARAKELLAKLAPGSRVLVRDTAAEPVSDRGDWIAPGEGINRIDALKITPASGSVNRAVEHALRSLNLAARGDDDALKALPRLLVVLSNRTVASWTGGEQRDLHEAADRLPAPLRGVQQLPANAAALLDLLKELRTKLPPPSGMDYPEQALIESVQAMRDRAGGLRQDDLDNDNDVSQLVGQVRRQVRAVAAALIRLDKQAAPDVEEYRQKTLAALNVLAQQLAGVQMLYLDVGVDQPVDVALLKIELPTQADGRMQQLFAADDKFIVRVLGKSFGKQVTALAEYFVDKDKPSSRQVELHADATQTIPLEIDLAKRKLEPGAHTLTVKLTSKDALESNNQVFAAFAIRQPKRVLVLADAKDKGYWFDRALKSVGYASEIKAPSDLVEADWRNYEAVYLCGLAQPKPALWQAAHTYVLQGGSLGIIPAGAEMATAAYDTAEARGLMPGTFKQAVQLDRAKPGAMWNLRPDRIFQHPILRPFRAWRDDDGINLTAYRRWAHGYWLIEPRDDKVSALVAYDVPNGPPALFERLVGGASGKVIVFTTPLDAREPAWNNYLGNDAPLIVAMALYVTRYLTGEDKGVNLNFQCGVDEPKLPLPLSPRFGVVTLQGADFVETLTVEAAAKEVNLRAATMPGNYEAIGRVAVGQPGTPLGKFSVNLPPEKGDLTRVPAPEIEAAFGHGSIVGNTRDVDLQKLLENQLRQPPLRLFPYLMILLLFGLALENLLANKFYRRDD